MFAPHFGLLNFFPCDFPFILCFSSNVLYSPTSDALGMSLVQFSRFLFPWTFSTPLFLLFGFIYPPPVLPYDATLFSSKANQYTKVNSKTVIFIHSQYMPSLSRSIIWNVLLLHWNKVLNLSGHSEILAQTVFNSILRASSKGSLKVPYSMFLKNLDRPLLSKNDYNL